MPSNVSSTTFEKALINLITLPVAYDSQDALVLRPSPDAVTLSCGCIITDCLVKELAHELHYIAKFKCPLCHSTTKVLSNNNELRKLYSLLKEQKIIDDGEFQQHRNRNQKQTLLSLFYAVASAIDDNDDDNESFSDQQHSVLSSSHSNALSFNSDKLQTTTSEIKSSASSISSSHNSTSITHQQQPSTSATTSHIPSTPQLPQQQQSKHHSLPFLSKFPSNASSRRRLSSTTLKPINHNPLSGADSPLDPEHKEYLFVKCFPTYRARYTHPTHSKLFKTKSKTFSNVSIAPNCKFFVLLSPKKWEVFKIPSNYKRAPILHCCGTSKGEYGSSFEKLHPFDSRNPDEMRGGGFSHSNDPGGIGFKSKMQNWEHLYCAMSDSLLVISGTNGIMRVFDMNQYGKPIYAYCSPFPIRCIDVSSDSRLIAYGITGKDRLSGSEQALIAMHVLDFDDTGVASATTTTTTTKKRGSNPSSSPYWRDDDENNYDSEPRGYNGSDDGEFNLLGRLTQVDPITITFPYHDPINHISFSIDCSYLSCSTALESRFLTVSVKDPARPKLVMKAIRSLDTSLESEGITSFKMFPNNKYMVVSSVAFNAPPIIIDNNIRRVNTSTTTTTGTPLPSTSTVTTTSGLITSTDVDLASNITKPTGINNVSTSTTSAAAPQLAPPQQSKSISSQTFQRVAQPKLLQRIDEVGNNIHKVAISPRNDSIALLDKNGTVYLMTSTKMDDPSSKRLVVVDQVSNSFRVRESAALCFSKDGHQLFVVDRKGVLYIHDFSAGLPSSPEITRCKAVVTE